MKTISPKTKLIYTLIVCIKEIQHFGFSTKINEVSTIIDGKCTEYAELYQVDHVKSGTGNRMYLLDIVKHLNQEIGEKVLSFKGEYITINEDFKGKYTFLFVDESEETCGFFAEINTLNKGINIEG